MGEPRIKANCYRDGVQMKDFAGKAMWVPLISFASKELRDRFSASVIEALRVSYPGFVA